MTNLGHVAESLSQISDCALCLTDAQADDYLCQEQEPYSS